MNSDKVTMNAEFYFRDKIPVAILGATGTVGQKFVELLISHPWFEITALAASERSVGKKYKDAVNWLMPTPLPPEIGNMVIKPCEPNFSCSIAFSALDSSIAGEVETSFADAGYVVISNSSNHRMDPNVPLVVPEVNAEHLPLAKKTTNKGMIVTNPNCSVIGLTIALKPLFDQFGLEAVNVVTMQAISGAGYPGVSGLDILDNVIPNITGEEEKIESEPLKIFGHFDGNAIIPAKFKISAQCNRVPVTDGHTECVSVKLKNKASKEDILAAWSQFKKEPEEQAYPSAPQMPIHYFEENFYPQPKLHRMRDKGMAVSIGRLRECPLFDYKFVILSHNTIRGAAGGSLLIAELMVKQGYVFW